MTQVKAITTVLIALISMLAASGSMAQPESCFTASPIDALISHGAQKRQVIFFGESHGTRQAPQFVSKVVCQLLKEGIRVHVAMEYPLDWQPALVAFARDGSNREELGNRWNQLGQFPDGRTSAAMWELMEDLAQQSRKPGNRLRLSTFDSRPFEPRFAGEYASADLGMALSLVKEIEAGDLAELTVVLSGELHARLAENTWKSKPRPMAWLASRARPDWLMSNVRLDAIGGKFWACFAGPPLCGIKEYRSLSTEADTPLGLRKFQHLSSDGFTHSFNFGAFDESAPFQPNSRGNSSVGKEAPL